ncbi:hypothetical protein phytr_3200 [Candidatus Phycorickettsia trachydisci]|uniref:Uncharacterized protein n=1 Tax=Candidatus Phycorickettsia trachydisci TaxID=2115978 RepID=A0A2P1P7N2_9RICK|nr:ankyrin repeat domain-containing protein [Candidatus Phycorickettsia trachydisci]AVP87274.1 hypothetical protein phytr_3200 [Candidatus Phycorickettsia trachydisci]
MIIDTLFTLARTQNLQEQQMLKDRVIQHTSEVEQEILSLKERGEDINPQDPNGFNLLYFIAAGLLGNNLLQYFEAHHIINAPGVPLLVSAATDNNLEMIHWLLQNGQNINVQDSDGETALHEAVRNGRVDIVQYLLENGANVNIRNERAETALCLAFLHVEDISLPIINLLVDHGFNLNAQIGYGNTALHEAVVHGQLETVRYLLNRGVDVNIRDNSQKNALLSFFNITDINRFGEREIFPNNVAINIINLLLEYGSDVESNVIDHALSPMVSSPVINETTKFTISLLLFANTNVPLSIHSRVHYYTDIDFLNGIFSVEGYDKEKIATGYNLYKALTRYGEVNQCQAALDAAVYINQNALNGSAHLLQLAIDIIKPHTSIRDIEQSNNIYLLRDNIIKCEELKELDIKLKELNIRLKGEINQNSPFYKFSSALNCVEEVKHATENRIATVFVKNLKLPELLDAQSLRAKLDKISLEPEEKILLNKKIADLSLQEIFEEGNLKLSECALLIKQIQAYGMKEVFNQGDLMSSVCSFLDPQSASDFSYTNKNPMETLITFPDQETSGNMKSFTIKQVDNKYLTSLHITIRNISSI